MKRSSLLIATLFIVKGWALQSSVALQSNHQAYLDVQELQATLLKKNATWEAGPNHLTKKPIAELRKMMLPKQKESKEMQSLRAERETTFLKPSADTELPRHLDWRNFKGQNWIGPVESQGDLPSCLIFANTAVMETQMTIQSGLSWWRPELSKQHMVSCSNDRAGFWEGIEATEPGHAAEYMLTAGVTDVACAPYVSGVAGQIPSCQSLCPDASARTIRALRYRFYWNENDIKSALQKGPVAGIFKAYDEFLAYKSGIYKHTTNDGYELHAALIIGYDDDEGYWIIRNSWGEDWGENGFARISYDSGTGLGREAIGFKMGQDLTSEIVAFQNLSSEKYVQGDFEIKGFSNFKNADGMRLVVKSQSHEINLECLTTSTCSFQLKNSSLPDGRYEAVLQALSKGEVLGSSEPKSFYLVNAQPIQAQVKLTDASGIPLEDSILSLNIGLQLTLESAPVPFNQFKLQFLKDGQEVKSWNVSGLSLPSDVPYKWQTISMPDGKYILRLEASIIVNEQTFFSQSQDYAVTITNSKIQAPYFLQELK